MQTKIVNLAELCSSHEKLISEISKGTGITSSTAQAIGNTIRTLTMGCESWPSFAIPALTLVPNGSAPEAKALEQAYELASSSNIVAERQMCGSLLAGPGSESDEFADVGFWCGEIDELNKEESILGSLSLRSWAEAGTVSGSCMRRTLDYYFCTQITRVDGAPLATLRECEIWELFEALGDVLEFRVERADSGGRVLHVAAGKGVNGWCGTMGVGVWS